LAVVSERTLLMNAAAARFLSRSDHESLWQFAVQATKDGDSAIAQYSTSAGTALNTSVEAIRDGGGVVGAMLRLRPAVEGAATEAPVRSGRGYYRPQYGWDSLTDPERQLADLVAEGLTNKEAAARLFVSHHTVDSHLRHIFRKLDINSRVALASLVTAARDGERAIA
jgi:DNA-binding CsgD family transcriptional regulator